VPTQERVGTGRVPGSGLTRGGEGSDSGFAVDQGRPHAGHSNLIVRSSVAVGIGCGSRHFGQTYRGRHEWAITLLHQPAPRCRSPRSAQWCVLPKSLPAAPLSRPAARRRDVPARCPSSGYHPPAVFQAPTFSPPTCARVICVCSRSRSISSNAFASTRPNRSSSDAMTPVQPVWWLAPSPAPLSP